MDKIEPLETVRLTDDPQYHQYADTSFEGACHLCKKKSYDPSSISWAAASLGGWGVVKGTTRIVCPECAEKHKPRPAPGPVQKSRLVSVLEYHSTLSIAIDPLCGTCGRHDGTKHKSHHSAAGWCVFRPTDRASDDKYLCPNCAKTKRAKLEPQPTVTPKTVPTVSPPNPDAARLRLIAALNDRLNGTPVRPDLPPLADDIAAVARTLVKNPDHWAGHFDHPIVKAFVAACRDPLWIEDQTVRVALCKPTVWEAAAKAIEEPKPEPAFIGVVRAAMGAAVDEHRDRNPPRPWYEIPDTLITEYVSYVQWLFASPENRTEHFAWLEALRADPKSVFRTGPGAASEVGAPPSEWTRYELMGVLINRGEFERVVGRKPTAAPAPPPKKEEPKPVVPWPPIAGDPAALNEPIPDDAYAILRVLCLIRAWGVMPFGIDHKYQVQESQRPGAIVFTRRLRTDPLFLKEHRAWLEQFPNLKNGAKVVDIESLACRSSHNWSGWEVATVLIDADVCDRVVAFGSGTEDKKTENDTNATLARRALLRAGAPHNWTPTENGDVERYLDRLVWDKELVKDHWRWIPNELLLKGACYSGGRRMSVGRLEGRNLAWGTSPTLTSESKYALLVVPIALDGLIERRIEIHNEKESKAKTDTEDKIAAVQANEIRARDNEIARLNKVILGYKLVVEMEAALKWRRDGWYSDAEVDADGAVHVRCKEYPPANVLDGRDTSRKTGTPVPCTFYMREKSPDGRRWVDGEYWGRCEYHV